jgi:hypothetical protein
MEPLVSVEQMPVSGRESAVSLSDAPESGRTMSGCSTEMAFSVEEMGISVAESAVSESPESISFTAEGSATTRWAFP